jgi:hypothetical protein
LKAFSKRALLSHIKKLRKIQVLIFHSFDEGKIWEDFRTLGNSSEMVKIITISDYYHSGVPMNSIVFKD